MRISCLALFSKPSASLSQALEKEAAVREEHTIAAGLEAAGARGRADHMEIEIERLRAQNDVLLLQNQNLLAWREQHHLTMAGGEPDAADSLTRRPQSRREPEAAPRRREEGRGEPSSASRGSQGGGPLGLWRVPSLTRNGLGAPAEPSSASSGLWTSSFEAPLAASGPRRDPLQPRAAAAVKRSDLPLRAATSLDLVACIDGDSPRKSSSKSLFHDKENFWIGGQDCFSAADDGGGRGLKGAMGFSGRKKASSSIEARSVSLDQIIADLSGGGMDR